MCTVTFIARKRGYALGMNRDEKLSRPKGRPPRRRVLDGIQVICPSEASGGTWIALNETGATLALINWYQVKRSVAHDSVSRGRVVSAASSAGSPTVVHARLESLPLRRINPFRLIGIFPPTGEIVEWRWNLRRLQKKIHPWKTQQWISSGFDEPEAQRIRGESFQKALGRISTPEVNWLRGLHRSHDPEAGPFSTCMHRADAATVSYTEIVVASGMATMRYGGGPPCESPFSSSKAHVTTQCLRLNPNAEVANRRVGVGCGAPASGGWLSASRRKLRWPNCLPSKRFDGDNDSSGATPELTRGTRVLPIL
jgi:hypothetical protein